MFRRSVSTLLLLLVSCTGTDDSAQREWHAVLAQKRLAESEGVNVEERQRYADAVRSFVERHPDHQRARQVWQELQLEFAAELVKRGRPRDAIGFYRAVLSHDPGNQDATAGLAIAASRLAVNRTSLLAIRRGMSRSEVEEILGRPLQGWTRQRRRSATSFEAWYYPTRDGGIAAIHFRDGRVLAAEENSSALLGAL
jgi:hypothetical protein